jgi:hypothetical protein
LGASLEGGLVGTNAAVPNVPGLEAALPLSHLEALELDYLPQHLIVIGGRYSGLGCAVCERCSAAVKKLPSFAVAMK